MDRPANQRPSFSAFFRSRLLPELEKFERVRKRRLPLLAAMLGGATASAIGLLLLLAPTAGRFLPYVAVGMILLLFPLLLLLLASTFLPDSHHLNPGAGESLGERALAYCTPASTRGAALAVIDIIDQRVFATAKRRRLFSRDVVAPTVDFTLPGLTSLAAEWVSQGDFLDSGLFGSFVGGYGGRDRFMGSVGTARYDFSWLRAEKWTPRRGRNTGGLLFSGWFFVVRFPRNFRGWTMVRPDVAEAALGWFGGALQNLTVPAGMEMIRLEDADFEERFTVHSSGQFEARYILSPAFMHLASTVRKRMENSLALGFRRDCMYAAFPGMREYFSLLPTRPFTDPAFCRHLHRALQGVRELADCLAESYVMWE